MRAAFTADTVTFDRLDSVYVAGLAVGNGEETYLMLQREVEGEEDGSGVYLEYRDELLAAYDSIQRCRVTRDRISIDLAKPLPGLPDVEGFDVGLNIDDAAYGRFVGGLPKVFRGKSESLLAISR